MSAPTTRRSRSCSSRSTTSSRSSILSPSTSSRWPRSSTATRRQSCTHHSKTSRCCSAAATRCPGHLFDTQLAAGFVGYSSPALTNLLSSELSIRLPKGDRLTDWLIRPLSDEQRAYAASDVAHLLELREKLVAKLEEVGRLEWALDECEEQRTPPSRPARPEPSVAAHQRPSSPPRGEPRRCPGGRRVA